METFEDILSSTPSEPVNETEQEDQTTEPVNETQQVAEPDQTEVAAPAVEEVQTEQIRQEPHSVPLAALIEQRDKVKKYSEEVETLRQQVAQYQAAQQQQQSLADPFDDPTAYRQQMMSEVRSQVAQEIAMSNFNQSRARAVAKYGQAVVNEVADWAGEYAKSDPSFEAKLFQQPDPAEWVVEFKKRQDLIKSFETDPDAYVRQRALELGLAEVAPATEANLTPASNTPAQPKSLAAAKSRDTVSTNNGALDDFDAIMKNR